MKVLRYVSAPSLFAVLLTSLLASCATLEDKVLNDGCPGPKDAHTGKVALLIDVNQSGKAENIRVIESKPEGMWDEAAKCIVRKGVFINNDQKKTPPFKDHRVEFDMKVTDLAK